MHSKKWKNIVLVRKNYIIVYGLLSRTMFTYILKINLNLNSPVGSPEFYYLFKFSMHPHHTHTHTEKKGENVNLHKFWFIS